MSQVAKIDDMDAANNIRFERVAETTSKALLQHTADLGMVVKLIHLETEALRSVKESLKTELAQSLREELSKTANSFGNQLFTVFAGKAATFWDNKFAFVSRVNDDLKKTIHSWSNLSYKSMGLLALASMLIGSVTFFGYYYLMPSQRLTKDEINFLYYGQVFALHHQKFSKELNNFFLAEANKLMKTTIVVATN